MTMPESGVLNIVIPAKAGIHCPRSGRYRNNGCPALRVSLTNRGRAGDRESPVATR
jgi:hypothetical protein